MYTEITGVIKRPASAFSVLIAAHIDEELQGILLLVKNSQMFILLFIYFLPVLPKGKDGIFLHCPFQLNLMHFVRVGKSCQY